MTDARDTILGTIRSVLGPDRPGPDAIAAEAAALVADPSPFRPKFDAGDTLARFIAKATSERVTATVSEVSRMDAVPGEVSAYLARTGLTASIALQPRAVLTELDWHGIEVHHAMAPDEPVAVSIADLAVAETGSVVFLSAGDAPTLMTFLPLHHIVVVEASLVRRHLEDVFEFVGGGPERQPRSINIVTGTSGTADIEAKNIRGAHGPRFMHIVVVGGNGA